MEDAASAACQTKFAGNRDAAAEEITRRLEGLTPLNLSNIHMNAESPNAAAELQPSMVQARATKLLTESSGALVQTNDGPLAPFATSLLLKFVSEAVNQLLDQQRDAVAQSCGGMITKYLGLGTLLGDTLGIEIPYQRRHAGSARQRQHS